MSGGLRLPAVLAWLWLFLSAPLTAGAEAGAVGAFIPADNSKALALFREGRYNAAYAAFWPVLAKGDPEAVFHGLIIRRNGLDGRAPAKEPEIAALTGLLANRAEFMRRALAKRDLPKTTADAYRTALAQLLYNGRIPLERPPLSTLSSTDYQARQRNEALALISSPWWGAPAHRYPPAQNFAAHLNLFRGGSAQRARALLKKSAEAGDRLGMINLSLSYREGLGGRRSDLKAAHWARRAADSEPPLIRALNEVGYYYETGRGVTKDLAEARAWYGKSAARGYQPGRNNNARLEETIMF
jgi:TPR repeat protein